MTTTTDNPTPRATRLTALLTRIEVLRATRIPGIHEHLDVRANELLGDVAATAKRSRAGEDIEPVLRGVVAEVAVWPSGLRDQVLARAGVMARHNLKRCPVVQTPPTTST